jgi:hypothetical protein
MSNQSYNRQIIKAMGVIILFVTVTIFKSNVGSVSVQNEHQPSVIIIPGGGLTPAGDIPNYGGCVIYSVLEKCKVYSAIMFCQRLE